MNLINVDLTLARLRVDNYQDLSSLMKRITHEKEEEYQDILDSQIISEDKSIKAIAAIRNASWLLQNVPHSSKYQ
jgi:hypothetical protein